MGRQRGSHASAAPEEGRSAVPRASRFIVIVSCVVAITAMVYGAWGPRPPAGGTLGATPSPSAGLVPSSAQSVDSPPAAASGTGPPHIGVVVGHWDTDTGALCADGLTEVEINLDVAQRVVHTLRGLDYQADLLKEFDPRLKGYWADALVSIHADSCEPYLNATPPASGFKVASVEDSLVPDVEERLVACLAQCYAARTGMYFHANSITYDMTRYHTFYEIDARTPAAIIETGFMLRDRDMLTQRPDLVAQGIVDGIICFLEHQIP